MYCILPFMKCIYFIFQAKMQIWHSSMKRVLQKFLKLEETSKYELTALWAKIAFHILFLVTHSIGAVRIYIQCLHLNYVNRYGYLVQCKYLLPATTHIISSLGDYERLITPATPGPDRVGGCRMIRTHNSTLQQSVKFQVVNRASRDKAGAQGALPLLRL